MFGILVGAMLALGLIGSPWSDPARGFATPANAGEPGPKRLYLANDDHTDYMWTATDLEYRQAFLQMLEFYMDQAEATATNPPDARGRFNCDGSLWVWEYEHNRPAQDFARLVSHLRDGTITMPLQTCVLLPGAMPAEAVLRNMYYAGRLERRENLKFPLVVAMENQTLPGGVASLWAGAGGLYSWRGICGCATQIDAGNRPRDVYHFTGPDGQSVCMKWNYFNGAGSLGGYAEAQDVPGAVSYMEGNSSFLDRWPWPVAGAFGHGGDALSTMTDEFIDASLTLSNPGRRVIVSNQIDFFEDFLANHGPEIPSFGGSFGNEWDLYTASMGEVTADFKRHVEKLRTAEALATVASLFDPAFMNGRTVERDSAFLACGLFYEHDWTADGAVPRSARAQFQRDRLRDLARYVDRLHDDALAAVASRVTQPARVERHVVFNPLSWARTDVVDLDVATPPPVHVVSLADGLEAPSEWVTVNGATRLRVLARQIPSVGYRVFEVRAGAGASFPPSATVTLPTLHHDRYSVTLGPRGNIVSLIDHQDGDRQLVDTATGSLNDPGSGSGTVTLENNGPVSTTLRVAAGGSPAHETRVTVYREIDRIDVENVVMQNFSGNVGYTSRFALPGAVMRHEEVGMIARVGRHADGGDYADQNTRTDYLTFNHFVDLSLPDRGITVSNWDSPFFAAGASTINTLDASPRIRAVVGMQVDGPGLGIQDQGGDARFVNRFAFRTHDAYDPAAAMRFALEHQNPLVGARVTGGAAGSLPATEWSLLALPSPDVLLWALKPAEEGILNGVIARVWNVADGPRSMQLWLPGRPLTTARQTSHIETDRFDVPVIDAVVSDDLARQEMRTYRLTLSESLGVEPTVPRPRLQLHVFPNPAPEQSSVAIAYDLPAGGHVRLSLHDVRGRRIATLIDRDATAGPGTVEWNGRDAGGHRVGPGLYFVRIEALGAVGTHKLVRM